LGTDRRLIPHPPFRKGAQNKPERPFSQSKMISVFKNDCANCAGR